jgi:hypothetical protein
VAYLMIPWKSRPLINTSTEFRLQSISADVIPVTINADQFFGIRVCK